MVTVDIGYLITMVRFKIGDTDPLAYRYLDSWLRVALISAVKFLERWWRSRYYVTDAGLVYRNQYLAFDTDENERVIETMDEYIIALTAAFLTLQGALENSAWSTVSWKDAEISFTNLEGGRIRDKNVDRLWNELQSFLLPPTKKLARATKGSLPGYKNNQWERDTEY
jgi:hypothetical protein